MATGYEVQMYHDIHRISLDLERIAKALEALTELAAKELEDEEGADAATFLAMTGKSTTPQQ